MECGCGLGKTSNFIFSNTKIDILGIDISETSINQSKKTYPHLAFQVDDIINIGNHVQYDCYFFSEITWYLLENKMIERIFDIMNEKCKGKYYY